eukprot:531906_1
MTTENNMATSVELGTELLDEEKKDNAGDKQTTTNPYTEEKALNITTDKQSEQQRKLNQQDSCWNFCKTDDLENLKKSEIEYSRGAFGENILHVAFLFRSNKCAKWLIDNHPKLAMQVYEDDEYYGESILHMAIATENSEMLDYILQTDNNEIDKEILINKIRAIGHFFNPKFGTVDYGEHALSFAVTLNQPETVTKLLKNGANISCIDANGNNILHYCAKYNLVDMFKHIITPNTKRECNIEYETFEKLIIHRNNDSFTFFQYAATLKQKEIFLCILEWKRIECWKWGPVSFIAYPLNEIDTHGDNRNSVLETILADNAVGFVDIPVIQAVLNTKWNDYAKRYFYVWCIINVLFVFSLLALYIYFLDALKNDKQNKLVLIVLIVVISGIKVFVTTSQTITEVKDLVEEHGKSRGMDIYFQWNLPDLSIIEFFHILLFVSNCLIICVWISAFLNNETFVIIFMTLSFITECLYLLYFGQVNELLGRLVISILRIITGDIIRFMIIFAIILFGFSGALCFVSIDITFVRAFMTLFYISLGVGDYWIEDESMLNEWQIVVNEIIYFFFLLISSVLLLNLLIAIFSETIDEIGNSSRQNWLFQRASTILLIERRVDKNCLCFGNVLYKRTGVKGETYGFQKNDAELFFIAFNLVDEKLEVPKTRPSKEVLDNVLGALKQNKNNFL